MNTLETETNTDIEIFDTFMGANLLKKNHRVAVRYIRNDIKASFSNLGLLGFSKYIPVKLLDISSKGVAIEYPKNLPLKKRITLDLLFEDNKKFSITAEIIRRASDKIQYGLAFDRFHHDLGDYLVYSQNELIFR
ncbi:MAG: PilZ domain-containing protein [Methylococcaceae bacterium]